MFVRSRVSTAVLACRRRRAIFLSEEDDPVADDGVETPVQSAWPRRMWSLRSTCCKGTPVAADNVRVRSPYCDAATFFNCSYRSASDRQAAVACAARGPVRRFRWRTSRIVGGHVRHVIVGLVPWRQYNDGRRRMAVGTGRRMMWLRDGCRRRNCTDSHSYSRKKHCTKTGIRTKTIRFFAPPCILWHFQLNTAQWRKRDQSKPGDWSETNAHSSECYDCIRQFLYFNENTKYYSLPANKQQQMPYNINDCDGLHHVIYYKLIFIFIMRHRTDKNDGTLRKPNWKKTVW